MYLWFVAPNHPKINATSPSHHACAIGFTVVRWILMSDIHWVLHTNKCTNCVSYISLKLLTLKHFHCSYVFR
jgi:hypothetical protein